MKTFLHSIYIVSIIIALIILFTSYNVFPQSNVISKPGQVIKLTWNHSIEPDVWQYAIFYCQGADTSVFPFNTGTDPDSLWMDEPIHNWSFASVYDVKYFHEPSKMAGTTYLRLGVAGINQAGQLGLIQCIPKVIRVKKPDSVGGVKVQ